MTPVTTRLTPARRRAWLALLLAVLALGATVTARPPDSPPLYDGIGFPDEPYRWVEPPAGESSTPQPATPASAKALVTDGRSAATRAFSSEQGPQVAFAVADGALAAPSGATEVTVTVTPEAVPGPGLPGTTVVSNLHRFSLSAPDGAEVGLAPEGSVIVNLRANTQTPLSVVVCQWDGSTWTQVPTRQVGTEIYAADLKSLDPFAVLRFDAGVSPTVAAPAGPPPGGAPAATGEVGDPAATPDGGTSGLTLGLIVAGVVVLLGAVLVVLRRRTGDA